MRGCHSTHGATTLKTKVVAPSDPPDSGDAMRSAEPFFSFQRSKMRIVLTMIVAKNVSYDSYETIKLFDKQKLF